MKNNFLFSLIALTIFSSSTKGQGTSQQQKIASDKNFEIGAYHVLTSKNPVSNEDVEANIQSQNLKDINNNFQLVSDYVGKDLSKEQLNDAILNVEESINELTSFRKNNLQKKLQMIHEQMGLYLINSTDSSPNKNNPRSDENFLQMKLEADKLEKIISHLEPILMMKYRELQYLNNLK